jgi:hydroxymethyl cephem carbamoyltransferase
MTSVLGFKPGHDGGVAYIDGGRLVYSYEAEKDSFERYASLNVETLLDALVAAPRFPDVIATGGWHKVVPGALMETSGGYRGLSPGRLVQGRVFGEAVLLYSTSHERTHIVSAVAMSPFDEDDLAVLVWEGIIGSFYSWRAGGRVIDRHDVLSQPGARFAALFALADAAFPDVGGLIGSEYAGKLMALAGCSDGRAPTRDSRDVVRALLGARSLYPFNKRIFRRSALYNRGVSDPEVSRAARYLSDELYGLFLRAASAFLPMGMPLVIAGGCGLNCEWNTAFRSSGRFSGVFVPPCANDTGSAIGAAADALVQLGEPARVAWTVYAGQSIVDDVGEESAGWTAVPANDADVARCLQEGQVVAWMRGRCEIGPRALGNRSLLASATNDSMRDRLNMIKGRESYRPIAPVCLEEDLEKWFEHPVPDPHMLFFNRVINPSAIPAVTHRDGTARVQSVSARSNAALCGLLLAYRDLTGVGVLCNTSLNFKGRGFINRTSDLLLFCDSVGITNAVVEGRRFQKAK